MLIKFESKRAAPFVMQSQIAEQLLSMAGLNGKAAGSISGDDISRAIANLQRALANQTEVPDDSMDEEEEREYVSIGSRAAPLKEMLIHALQVNGYVMWGPE
ncbi:MAG: hypothetical protein DHS20C12_24950 [Pseudohongiella sp.]|nr:MAG: hypothetical protein DHS20C12_24950 [Pseudohongiella sp.]